MQTDLQTCAVIVFLVCPQLGFARSLRPGEKVRPVAAAALLLTSLFQGSLSCGGTQVARHITLVSVSALPTPVSHLGDTALASHHPPQPHSVTGDSCVPSRRVQRPVGSGTPHRLPSVHAANHPSCGSGGGNPGLRTAVRMEPVCPVTQCALGTCHVQGAALCRQTTERVGLPPGRRGHRR